MGRLKVYGTTKTVGRLICNLPLISFKNVKIFANQIRIMGLPENARVMGPPKMGLPEKDYPKIDFL